MSDLYTPFDVYNSRAPKARVSVCDGLISTASAPHATPVQAAREAGLDDSRDRVEFPSRHRHVPEDLCCNFATSITDHRSTRTMSR